MYGVYEYELCTKRGELRVNGKPKLLDKFRELADARRFSERKLKEGKRQTFIEFSREAIQAIQQEQQQ